MPPAPLRVIRFAAIDISPRSRIGRRSHSLVQLYAKWSSLPPTIDRVRAGRRTPLHPSRADDERREVLPSVPIAGHTELNAANTQQSLSSYPAGRQRLTCFRPAGPARHPEFPPLLSMERRSWPILLHSRPLQRKRISECFLVIGIEICQLLYFHGRSRQQN